MGTSAATPLAAGSAALLRAANPNWDAATVIAALRSSATTVATLPVPLLNVAPALGIP
jgi:subtilisin family serine protease